MTPARISGTQPARLQHVDALRGFALLGILAVNIWSFADPYYASPTSNPAYSSALDHLVRWLVSVFFEAKFYLLFSFLFGYSFTLQMSSAERSGRPSCRACGAGNWPCWSSAWCTARCCSMARSSRCMPCSG